MTIVPAPGSHWRRRSTSAECSVDDELVPVVADALTRVAPLDRGIAASRRLPLTR